MRIWIAILVIGAVSACSQVTTTSHVASGASLDHYRTYQWANETAATRTPGEQAVRAALQRGLAQRGMMPATNGAPDFIVAYHAERKDKAEAVPRAGYRWWGAPEMSTVHEGTLVVDFVDSRTDGVFWHGTAVALVDHPDHPDFDKIDKAVSRLLEKYPTATTAAASRPAM